MGATKRHPFRRGVRRASIKLLLFQWVALDHIAHRTGSIALKGVRRGNRSWRTLLRRIAEGELLVIPRPVVIADAPQLLDKPEPIGPPVHRNPGRPILQQTNTIEVQFPSDWFHAPNK